MWCRLKKFLIVEESKAVGATRPKCDAIIGVSNVTRMRVGVTKAEEAGPWSLQLLASNPINRAQEMPREEAIFCDTIDCIWLQAHRASSNNHTLATVCHCSPNPNEHSIIEHNVKNSPYRHSVFSQDPEVGAYRHTHLLTASTSACSG